MDPDGLAEARGQPRLAEEVQEDPEEHQYAEVHHEDPDAIRVVQEEPGTVPEAVSRAGSGAAMQGLPPPKPLRLGWIRRGPRRFHLRTVQEEDIVPDAASTEV
jgi:hypothetical protein